LGISEQDLQWLKEELANPKSSLHEDNRESMELLKEFIATAERKQKSTQKLKA